MTIVRDMPPLPPSQQQQQQQEQQQETATPAATPSSSAFAPEVAGGFAEGEPDNRKVATLSNPWEFDAFQPFCTSCRCEFNPLNRRHHCRSCGKIFCHHCSNQRALIPPSSIVLAPEEGKKAKPRIYSNGLDGSGSSSNAAHNNNTTKVSFSPDEDPDRMLTYMDDQQTVLYGKGLEERFHLAREPLRVCMSCHTQLQPLQEELRISNSNAMRFNHIDPTDTKRLFNSPLAFTLGHEVRKAAYTLNNLLPLPKRMGSVIMQQQQYQPEAMTTAEYDQMRAYNEIQQCKEECSTLSPNLAGLDGVQIPAKLLEQAKGVAVMTVFKGGFGLAGAEFGTGLVVARLGDGQWSAPCAIGAAGLSWGALIGAQVSDHVFLLMTNASVELLFSSSGSIQLGADVGVAVGPVGRSLEADFGAAPGSAAPIYTYSFSKGFYAGISLDGKVIVIRNRVNEKFYGREVSGAEFLQGTVPTPPAARPLYDALTRCHVYATGDTSRSSSRNFNMSTTTQFTTTGQFQQQQQQQQQIYPHNATTELEYGEPQPMMFGNVMPPAPNDQHSFAGLSDITSDPGY